MLGEDGLAALERLRPIPRGGARLQVEAPGLGTLRIRVVPAAEGLRVTVDAAEESSARALQSDREGLLQALATLTGEKPMPIRLEIGHDPGLSTRQDAGHGEGRGAARENHPSGDRGERERPSHAPPDGRARAANPSDAEPKPDTPRRRRAGRRIIEEVA
jgi:hypothetical protein